MESMSNVLLVTATMGTKSLPILRKGAWTEEEDVVLRKCVHKYGEGNWHKVRQRAGLNRCRKSCRLRWLNYLRPYIKRGEFAWDEVDLIIRLHKLLGNRWSLIAGRLPGRTANDIKNYWSSHQRRKIVSHQQGRQRQQEVRDSVQKDVKIIPIKPRTRRPRIVFENLTQLENVVANDIQSKGNPSEPSLIMLPSDENIWWWESLLVDKEGEKAISTNFTSKKMEEELIVKVKEISLGRVVTFTEKECQSGLGDLYFDMENLWDFVSTEPK